MATSHPGESRSGRREQRRPLRYPPLVVIAGATATGKTGLSIELAQRLAARQAEIISADSRQVYRGMDIGTAKATADQRAQVPHHGLDLVDPDQAFTAADFRRHALEALDAIAARDRLALLVGGTGLYLRAVARGFPLEDTGRDAQVRVALERRLATEGPDALVAELRAAAPGVAARVDLANPRRVVRALERVAVRGDVPPPAPRGYPARSVWIGLTLDPAENARRIAERARAQFTGGLLEEAASLRERYGVGLPAFSALGYSEAFDVLDGRLTLEAAIERNIARNRRLARRQRSWFRAEPDITWLDAAQHPAALLEQALDLVDPLK